MTTRKRKYKLVTDSRKEYIYIIHRRDIEDNDDEIYKIGRTHNLSSRLGDYPPNSVIYKVIRVNNCYFTEDRLISTFHLNFKHRNDYGKEYFEGKINDMMECMQLLADRLGQTIDDPSIMDNVRKYYSDRHRIYENGIITDYVSNRYGKVVYSSDNDHTRKRVKVIKKRKNLSESNEYSCDNCNAAFSDAKGYNYHVEYEVCANKNFFCDYCNKGFTKKNSMYRHQKHTCKFRIKETDEESNTMNERMEKLENICATLIDKLSTMSNTSSDIDDIQSSKRNIASRTGKHRKAIVRRNRD